MCARLEIRTGRLAQCARSASEMQSCWLDNAARQRFAFGKLAKRAQRAALRAASHQALTGNARPRFFEEQVRRARSDDATVGCKPFAGLRGSSLRFPPINNKAWGPQAKAFSLQHQATRLTWSQIILLKMH